MSQTRKALAALACASLTGSALAQTAERLWNFTTYVDLENSILRPNGQLLFTTLTNPQLYTVDTTAAEPKAEVVRWFPGVTALNGLSKVGDDKYAVTGGVRGSFHYTNETVFTIDFSESSAANPNVTALEVVATLPDAIMLNGLANLPSNPHILLAADSRVATIWRIDIDTGSVAPAINSTLFSADANATAPIGIDGLKVSDDGAYAYFTNVYQAIFGRVPISDDGTTLVATGEAEIVTQFTADGTWDDFYLNGTVAYGAQDPSLLGRIDTTTGEQTNLFNITELAGGPTSVTPKGDGLTWLLTSNGDSAGALSGEVWEIIL
ncbi:hypothetical protein BD289DRAFT_484234 [Coniella lustricola]|uniref:Uncharacterized protein n=1 Tax=Coniella lustricola TaxID=2025994 RepID=A0A2T3A2Q8_9PEZI|nr:hypothetical protein BD289DRAFT_484234 [Coniella lustricola]